MQLPLITSPDQVAEVCERFAAESVLGVDTEFVRERTYYPRLCLVQLAAGEESACLDPVAAADHLQPLARLLGDESVVKVFHAARQDLEVLQPVHGCVPVPLFDTQVAAALCGYADQISYGALVEAVLGVALDKSHTRTDWCRRPLSAEQMRYAVDDVRYLCSLHRHLHARLEELGRLSWMEEEMRATVDLASDTVADQDMFSKVRGARSLHAAGQHRLQRLAAWRESQARRRNLPRAWVVPDAALLAVAAQAPADVQALLHVPGIGSGTARRDGEALLRELRHAEQEPQDVLLEPVRPLSGQERALCARLMDKVRRRGAELGVAAPLLATRRDVEALVRGDRDGAVMSGWRRQAVGEALVRALDGER